MVVGVICLNDTREKGLSVYRFLFVNRIPDDETKPWMLILTFSAHPEGRHLRSLWSHASLAALFQTVDGRWPDLTVKSGQWKASRLYQEVCGDVGWTPPGKTSRPRGVKRPSPTPEGRDTRTRR